MDSRANDCADPRFFEEPFFYKDSTGKSCTNRYFEAARQTIVRFGPFVTGWPQGVMMAFYRDLEEGAKLNREAHARFVAVHGSIVAAETQRQSVYWSQTREETQAIRDTLEDCLYERRLPPCPECGQTGTDFELMTGPCPMKDHFGTKDLVLRCYRCNFKLSYFEHTDRMRRYWKEAEATLQQEPAPAPVSPPPTEDVRPVAVHECVKAHVKRRPLPGFVRNATPLVKRLFKQAARAQTGRTRTTV
jgi:hypothetical protein